MADALQKAGLDPANYGFAADEANAEETYVLDPNAMPEKLPVTGSIQLTDVKGREVTIDLPISTYAISTMDVIDYMIPLMGEEAFSKLVASGQDGGGGLQTYAKLYTPVVGNYMAHVGQISDHNAPFDLEMILAQDPDILIVNSAMGAHNYALEVEEQLTEAGIPIFLIDVPGKSFTTSVQSTLEVLGKIFEKEERAKEVISFIDEQFALIASKNLNARTDQPSVYYEKSGYSQIFGSTSTSKSGWGTVIAAAGGDNIAGQKPAVPRFDIVNRTGWSALQAVKNENVYELAHASSRAVFGFYPCLKMATIFYPEDFKDVDPEAVMDEFFERFMLVDSDVTGWCYRLGEVS